MKLSEFSLYNHSISFPVRFMDIDPMHHVNNARYLNYLEEARIAYWKDVFQVEIDSPDFNAVVARIEIDFKAPIFFGEEVTVYSRVSRMGNSSMTYDCTITSNKKGKTKIAAHTVATIVRLDPKTKKSIPLDEKHKDTIRKYESMPKK